ncbi:MAG: AAA family ATPase [Solirubrobacterales bacterium]
MTKAIPLEQAERVVRHRPTAEGSKAAWLALDGPVHAPSLAYKPMPSREWSVEGVIPLKAVCLLSGDGGAGKSTLALQLACSTVLGAPWLGRPTRAGKVAYVSCEDDLDELHRRLVGICDGEGWNIDDLDGLELFDRVGRDNAVMMRGEGFGAGWEDTPWWMRMSNWLRDFSPALVVLDSLYDFFPGNQLDQAAARTFMGKLRETAHDAGCAIVVLWHPSKSGMESGDGTSGNVAFRNAARAMLYLERDKEAEGADAPLILRGKKNNYGPDAAEIRIRWEDGRFVVVAPEGGQSGFFGKMDKRAADLAFLAALDAATDQGRNVAASKGSNYAPKVLGGMPQTAGYKVRDLERAMERLFSAGEIEVGRVGQYTNRTPKMGIRRKSSVPNDGGPDE